jgi:D-methionine transport system substrate-binding protein
LGIYPGKVKSLDAIAEGATIAIPNDTTNEARALLLLETDGLIKVNPKAGFKATVKDITQNPKNIKIKELEAAQLARTLPDVDVAVINGNFALQAGFNVEKDALAKEEANSVAAKTYINVLAIRKGDENREDIKALVDALKSEKVKKFIEEKYKGAVVPLF